MTENDFDAIFRQFLDLDKVTTDRKTLLLKTCELLNKTVSHYDWVGFYLMDRTNQELVLGPYVGKATEHTHIGIGKGVCGQVAESKQTKVVQDVSQEANYIACSIDVQSEIVVPVLKGDEFVAEIDIDSHATAPFTSLDEAFLARICDQIALRF